MSQKNQHRHPLSKKWVLGTLSFLIVASSLYLLRPIAPIENKPPEEKLILNRGLIGDPESLDPHNFRSKQASTILRDIGEGLVAYSPSGSIVGGVAKSWEISEDGLTYRFVFRENSRWSNGALVKPHHFVSTFRKLVDPKQASSNAHLIQQVSAAIEIQKGLKDIEELGISEVSDFELQIRLRSPSSYFLQVLTHPSTFPIHYDPHTRRLDTTILQVSNGAYTLSKRIIGSEIVITKNENYWNRENIAFDTVVYHIVQEAAELNRFRAGELDITANVSPGNFPSARAEFPRQLRVAPYAGIYYYGFNLENSIFADRQGLRKALSLAIDRDILVEKITGRGEEPAFGWVPPGITKHSPQSMGEADLSKKEREALARQLYAQSGFGPDNPLKFQLRYNVSDVQQTIALAAQAMWREVLGAEANLVAEEFRVLLANITDKYDTEVFRLSWIGDYDDAQSFLQLFETNNSSNLTGYSNPLFDEVMQKASRESDPSRRRELLESAERIIVESHAVIPMYFYVSKHLVSDGIDGWTDNVLDIHPSQHLRPSVK